LKSERPTVAPTIFMVVGRENMRTALKRVQANKGAPGIDGMTVEALPRFLLNEWPAIKRQLLSGTYRPKPVRRVEIPKPDGGKRLLGIPSVIDRLIQQATMQVLQASWNGTFSEHSHGFRPHRSAHGAVNEAQGYALQGKRVVVDIDLEKFFDRVNHDILMGLVRQRVDDVAIIKLIRSYLSAGVMIGGLTSATREGVPQGGPLSPLLSNLMLDVLDRELERRGHSFVRYADDCNIYVASHRAGERVMASVTDFLATKLKLRVNPTKSAVDYIQKRPFLGFILTWNGDKVRIAPKSLLRLWARIRELTSKTGGRSLEDVIENLSAYLRGWYGYFRLAQTRRSFERADEWTRRRLRCLAWKQWKTSQRRYAMLRKLGVPEEAAAMTTAGARRFGTWHMSMTPGLTWALRPDYLRSLGLFSLLEAATV
jgi:RNA-directed DNA polymerase